MIRAPGVDRDRLLQRRARGPGTLQTALHPRDVAEGRLVARLDAEMNILEFSGLEPLTRSLGSILLG